jgi:hypothetical protein
VTASELPVPPRHLVDANQLGNTAQKLAASVSTQAPAHVDPLAGTEAPASRTSRNRQRLVRSASGRSARTLIAALGSVSKLVTAIR